MVSLSEGELLAGTQFVGIHPERLQGEKEKLEAAVVRLKSLCL